MARKQPPLAVTYRALDDLVPYARNARTHSDEQVAQIAASIREFGWTNPILIGADGSVIAGHGRLMAARKLGMDKVPTISLGDMTDAQRRAYVLADNRLAENAGWDNDLLKIELADLHGAGFDLGLLGFSTSELSSLLGLDAPPPEPQQDDAYQAQWGVLVSCTDEAHQETVFNDLQQRGYTVKPVSV